MPLFAYTALRPDGSTTSGTIDAGGRLDAMQSLDSQGLQPIGLEETTAAAPRSFGWRRSGVSDKSRETATRQLASLLGAGVPLSQALQLLATESPDTASRDCWQAVHKDVADGTSLSQSMERQSHVFPRVYAAMVNAGETGGFLELVLRQIADFQTRDRDLRGKVSGALIYPAVLALLATGVVIFLMTFFIPKFQAIFDDFGAPLPPLTNAIVAMSVFCRNYGWLIAIALIIGFILLRNYQSTVAGRIATERFVLRLPVLGPILCRFALTRFSRMLGTLAHAGVPLIQSLRVARESIGNETLAQAVDGAIRQVQQGEPLGRSLGACPQLFSRATVAMISVAEKAGRLDEELVRLADDGERDLDRQLRAAVSLAEPAMLFVMAGVVGLIVIGMVLPIFAIQDYIQ